MSSCVLRALRVTYVPTAGYVCAHACLSQLSSAHFSDRCLGEHAAPQQLVRGAVWYLFGVMVSDNYPSITRDDVFTRGGLCTLSFMIGAKRWLLRGGWTGFVSTLGRVTACCDTCMLHSQQAA
jgi:hypothetical protein